VAAAVTVMVYGLWVITVPRESTTATLISLMPFTLGLLVYALVIDSGKGGEPETAILRNPTLLVLSALWAVSLVAVLYL
jgi:decaprenyl-phosphate phosphoribosyltransferase